MALLVNASMDLPLSESAVTALKALAAPSTHGIQDASGAVVSRHTDPAVRASWEVHDVRLSSALVALVHDAATACGERDASRGVTVPSTGTVVLYEVGGHFAAHTDRARGPAHWGTAIVLLPTAVPFAGGALTINDEAVPFVPSTEPQVAIVPLGAVHAVAPVTSGVRVAMTVPLSSSTT